MAHNIDEIAGLLQNTVFKRCIIGGVDEDDVWKKIEQLDKEYTELYDTVRLKADSMTNQWKRYAASLEKSVKSKDEMIEKMNAELNALREKGVGNV